MINIKYCKRCKRAYDFNECPYCRKNNNLKFKNYENYQNYDFSESFPYGEPISDLGSISSFGSNYDELCRITSPPSLPSPPTPTSLPTEPNNNIINIQKNQKNYNIFNKLDEVPKDPKVPKQSKQSKQSKPILAESNLHEMRKKEDTNVR